MLLWPDEILTVEPSFALGIGSGANFYLANLSSTTYVKRITSINDNTPEKMSRLKVLKIRESD